MSTITMRGVAGLARVQRPVVSMWRSRTRHSDDPFPAPLNDDANAPQFDADAVAAWLVRTGRGNNPDAALDAAAYCEPSGPTASTAVLTALLTLRELHGSPIGALSPTELQTLALQADPDDVMLRAEIGDVADGLQALARHVDAAVDAEYTASATLSRLLRADADRDRALGLTEVALELFDAITERLVADLTESTGLAPTLIVHGAGASPLVRRLVSVTDREIDVAVGEPASADDLRLLRRVLAVSGQQTDAGLVTDDAHPHACAVHVVQLPVAGAVDAVAGMTGIDDVALSMTDDQRALVVGPASLLVDPLDGEADRMRSNILRLGRVRAIVRLPRGCAPGAPRAHLALWALGPSQHDVPVAERSIATLDLDGTVLTPDVQHDVVLDLASSLGDSYERHLRAFRFAMPVLQRTLLALGRRLVPPRIRRAPLDVDAELVSRFLEVRGRVEDFGADLPGVAPADSAHTPLSPALLGDLVRERQIRRIAGTRLPAELRAGDGLSGFRVITADDVREARPASRYVDRLGFAQLGRSARLTDPGDVIVVGGDRPAALLDELGATVVEAPAAILRVDRRASAPIEPALLQHDITRFASGDWRTWPVRRIAVSAHEALRESMDGIGDRIAALQTQITRLEEYERALVDGFVAGVLAPDAEYPRKDTEQGDR